jgi:hypothetical protein
MQNFKGSDEIEKQFEDSAAPVLDAIGLGIDDFYDDAFQSQPLGDVIHDSGRAPLTNAIKKEIFRIAFKEIFDAFIKVGTFEAYLTVFKKIFGDNVDVQFAVPAPGKLNIDIEATDINLSEFVARYISENTYLFDSIIDDEGDFIVFQTIKGFETQYELERMLFEMVPGGIYTEITLTIGGA